MDNLSTKSHSDLVSIYNSFRPKERASLSSICKDVLIKRITTLQSASQPRARVRAIAVKLLCEIAFYERLDMPRGEDNRFSEPAPGLGSVGHSYQYILDAIKRRCPNAKTTLACVRWYAVKLRNEDLGYEGHKLPRRRPRKSASKKG